MRLLILGVVGLIACSSVAAAQDDAAWRLHLPKSPAPSASPEFELGPRVGYLKTRGADSGTWLGGVQMRARFMEYVAAEASITFHEDDFDDFDVQTYPVELSGLIYPFPDLQIKPYAVGGAGWYYTRIDYDAANLDDESDHFFAVHIGGGAEMNVGDSISLNADLRYVFVNDPNLDVEDEEFDYWQFTAGANWKF